MSPLFLVLTLSLPVPASQERGLGSAPFELVASTGPRGAATLAVDREALAALAREDRPGASVVVDDFPLPDGTRLCFLLRPVSVLAPGARARVVEASGKAVALAPTARCFAGAIEGGGQVFLGVAPDGVLGTVSRPEGLYVLAGDGASGRLLLSHASALGSATRDFCALSTAPELERPDRAGRMALTTPELRIADVFIEVDDNMTGLFGSPQACLDYVAILLTASSEICHRDLGLELRIPDLYLRLWKTTPPWGNTTFQAVHRWWTGPDNPERDLPRAAVHTLTRSSSGSGAAWEVNGTCDPVRGYEISSIRGGFSYPTQHTSGDNFDLFVVTHEFGHTFGSIHGHDYRPPIECADGSGPDSGTLMSYCHARYGMENMGMRFHLREQERIRERLLAPRCLKRVPLRPGDYDHDGRADPDDLALADAFLAQGFRSLGAEDAFDLDRDGDLDGVDRELLAELVGASSSSTAVAPEATARRR